MQRRHSVCLSGIPPEPYPRKTSCEDPGEDHGKQATLSVFEARSVSTPDIPLPSSRTGTVAPESAVPASDYQQSKTASRKKKKNRKKKEKSMSYGQEETTAPTTGHTNGHDNDNEDGLQHFLKSQSLGRRVPSNNSSAGAGDVSSEATTDHTVHVSNFPSDRAQGIRHVPAGLNGHGHGNVSVCPEHGRVLCQFSPSCCVHRAVNCEYCPLPRSCCCIHHAGDCCYCGFQGSSSQQPVRSFVTASNGASNGIYVGTSIETSAQGSDQGFVQGFVRGSVQGSSAQGGPVQTEVYKPESYINHIDTQAQAGAQVYYQPQVHETRYQAPGHTQGQSHGQAIGQFNSQVHYPVQEHHYQPQYFAECHAQVEAQNLSLAEGHAHGQIEDQAQNDGPYEAQEVQNPTEDHTHVQVESHAQDLAQNQSQDEGHYQVHQVQNLPEYHAQSQVQEDAQSHVQDHAEGHVQNEVQDQTQGQAHGQVQDQAKDQVDGQAEDQGQDDDQAQHPVQNLAGDIVHGHSQDQTEDHSQSQSQNLADDHVQGKVEGHEDQTKDHAKDDVQDHTNHAQGQDEGHAQGQVEVQAKDDAQDHTDHAQGQDEGHAQGQVEVQAKEDVQNHKNHAQGQAQGQVEDQAENQTKDHAQGQADDHTQGQVEVQSQAKEDAQKHENHAQSQDEGKAEEDVQNHEDHVRDQAKAQGQVEGQAKEDAQNHEDHAGDQAKSQGQGQTQDENQDENQAQASSRALTAYTLKLLETSTYSDCRLIIRMPMNNLHAIPFPVHKVLLSRAPRLATLLDGNKDTSDIDATTGDTFSMIKAFETALQNLYGLPYLTAGSLKAATAEALGYEGVVDKLETLLPVAFPIRAAMADYTLCYIASGAFLGDAGVVEAGIRLAVLIVHSDNLELLLSFALRPGRLLFRSPAATVTAEAAAEAAAKDVALDRHLITLLRVALVCLFEPLGSSFKVYISARTSRTVTFPDRIPASLREYPGSILENPKLAEVKFGSFASVAELWPGPEVERASGVLLALSFDALKIAFGVLEERGLLTEEVASAVVVEREARRRYALKVYAIFRTRCDKEVKQFGKKRAKKLKRECGIKEEEIRALGYRESVVTEGKKLSLAKEWVGLEAP